MKAKVVFGKETMITKQELETALVAKQYVEMEIEASGSMFDCELRVDEDDMAFLTIVGTPSVIAQLVRIYAISRERSIHFENADTEVQEMVSFLDSVS